MKTRLFLAAILAPTLLLVQSCGEQPADGEKRKRRTIQTSSYSF